MLGPTAPGFTRVNCPSFVSPWSRHPPVSSLLPKALSVVHQLMLDRLLELVYSPVFFSRSFTYSPVFFSCSFTVLKWASPMDKFVFDLSALNRFVVKRKFQMMMLAKVWLQLWKGLWLAALSLEECILACSHPSQVFALWNSRQRSRLFSSWCGPLGCHQASESSLIPAGIER